MKCEWCKKEFNKEDLEVIENPEFHYFCKDCAKLLGESWDFCERCGEILPIDELNYGLCEFCND